MTTTIEGLDELRIKRKQLNALAQCIHALAATGLHNLGGPLVAQEDRLANELVTVAIPCLLCPTTVEHVVAVAGDETPHAALCGPCADAPDAHIVR